MQYDGVLSITVVLMRIHAETIGSEYMLWPALKPFESSKVRCTLDTLYSMVAQLLTAWRGCLELIPRG